MKTKYSLKDLYDMLEVCDAHDAYKHIAHKKALQEQNTKVK
jgi:hypothetical protein